MPARSPDKTQLGTAIRREREAGGLTIEELAQLAEIDKSHLSHVERGSRSVGFGKLCAINDALDRTSLSELIALAETMPKAQ